MRPLLQFGELFNKLVADMSRYFQRFRVQFHQPSDTAIYHLRIHGTLALTRIGKTAESREAATFDEPHLMRRTS